MGHLNSLDLLGIVVKMYGDFYMVWVIILPCYRIIVQINVLFQNLINSAKVVLKFHIILIK